MLECLLRRRYDPAELLAAHPPRIRHPHKQLVFELACPARATHAGATRLQEASSLGRLTMIRIVR